MTSKKMFSAYSWWDFIKVALCLTVPYYLFVAWKYYREDIREWLGSRGEKGEKKLVPATEPSGDDPGQLTKGLFTAQTYPALPTMSEPVAPAPAAPAVEPNTAPPAPAAPPVGQSTPAAADRPVADRPAVTNEASPTTTDDKDDEEEPDGLLGDGPVVSENIPVVIPFAGTLLVPTESSLKELIATGQHLRKEDNGLVTAPEGDAAGNQLADFINQQHTKAAGLEGISFNRR